MLPHFDIATFIIEIGYVGIFSIVGAESGLFFGFFLPGDSMLFTAGILAAGHTFNLWILLLLVPLAAILGDSLGYWIGALIGPRIFTRKDSFFFNRDHVVRSKNFYTTYGPRAIVLARFIPVVRTFVPLLAGVGSMRYRTFFFYNVVGGCLWGAGVLLLGYFLGHTFPAVQQYLLPLVLLIVIISLAPLVREWWVHRKSKHTS
jgi:membrane-associated protein